MPDTTIHRRDLLVTLGLLGLAAPLHARTVGGDSFDPASVDRLARQLATKPYVAPSKQLPPSLDALSYDAYRGHRFDRSKALWAASGDPVIAEPMLRGWLFRDKVELFGVVDGKARPLPFENASFAFEGGAVPADAGFSGLRYLGPLNSQLRDELAVFQGASYFRSLARGQLYGISARGLALGAGGPSEEFPIFRAFWLERPQPDMVIRLHALLDSPSIAGAYHFTIRPGDTTVFDVDARLYPRSLVGAPGVAPMSSMFMFGAGSPRRFDDFRPAVHDSDGLEMWTGEGERLWRPLSNPHQVRISAFTDENPRGFGLMQRAQRFADFNDAEARYDRRPSLWVEPVGRWGKGSVQLLEIPAADEFADNVAAFWRPAEPWRRGQQLQFAYRLHWGRASSAPADVARVITTRVGAIPGGRHFAIDYDRKGLPDPATIAPRLVAAGGAASPVRIEALPDADVVRASFDLRGQGGDVRLDLEQGGRRVSESWLNRWSA